MAIAVACFKCTVTDEVKRLKKCPICFKHVCEECSHFFAGRYFCSKGCAQVYFFGIGEDDEE